MEEEGSQLLEELMRFKPEGMTANAWAVQAGVGRTIWADLKRHGNPSRRTLSKLLEAAGSTLAEFEALRIDKAETPIRGDDERLAEGNRAWRGARPAAIPLLAMRLTGYWGDTEKGIELYSIDRSRVIGTVDRPAALAEDSNTYAVTIMGKSMWPRFRAGRRVAVSPAARIQAGDDVLVLFADNGEALIGELISQATNAVRLRQFNPALEFEIPAAEVMAVHMVVGELI